MLLEIDLKCLHFLTGDGCTQGFPSNTQVASLTRQCSSSCERDTGSSSGSTYIVPGMTFTCAGSITRWMAGGVPRYNGFDAVPKLEIWRESSPSSSLYNLVEEISLLECNGVSNKGTEIESNLYGCSLNTAVPVQPGDILGVHLTRVHQNRNRFAVFFATNTIPLQTVYAYEGSRTSFSLTSPGASSTEQALPLIALEVSPNGNNPDHHIATLESW